MSIFVQTKANSTRLVAGFAAFALLLTAVGSVTTLQASATTGYGYGGNVPAGPVNVLRSVSTVNGDHLYTVSAAENAAIQSQNSYKNEGAAFKAYDKTAAGSSPVYRALKPSTGDHFYAVSFAEYANSMRHGYQLEGVAFNAFANGSDAPVGEESDAVYRAVNKANGEHFYALAGGEFDSAVSGDYIREGVAFYAPR